MPRVGYFSFSLAAKDVIRGRMDATDLDMRWFRTLHGAACKAMGMAGAVLTWRDYETFSTVTKMRVEPDDRLFDLEDMTVDYGPALRAYNLSQTTLKPASEIIRAMPYHINLTQSRYDAFVSAWVDFKKSIGKWDFTDMLVEYDRSGEPLPIDEAYLDEAQDLSELQWRVFHKMVANCSRVTMAGDDDQSIYGFIGASEYGFLDHACDEQEVLKQSHRVPRLIGDEADKIIRRVAHRKDKGTQWVDKLGSVTRMNMEPDSLPWRSLLDRHGSIMALTRHKAGARQFSEALKGIGIQHTFQGETMNSWKESKVVSAYFTLKTGGKVTTKAANTLLVATGNAEIDFGSDRIKVTKEMLPHVDFTSAAWVRQFAGNSYAKRAKYEALRRLVARDGPEALSKEPQVSVGTMHSAKGKEADLVIIVPECTGIVKHNLSKPTEVRLAYVSLTRAKNEVVLLLPRSDTYITHFFGG